MKLQYVASAETKWRRMHFNDLPMPVTAVSSVLLINKRCCKALNMDRPSKASYAFESVHHLAYEGFEGISEILKA